MKRMVFITTLLMCCAAMTAWGEVKKEGGQEQVLTAGAEIKDHLTHDPIKGVRGELLWAADSSFVDTLKVSYEEGEGWKYSYFSAEIKKAGNYLIRLEADGYATRYVPLEIKKMYRRERYKSIKTVYLKKQPKKTDIELD